MYFKPKSDEVTSDFTLYYCGNSADEKKNSWGPGVRDYYTFYYVNEGEGYLTVHGEEYHLKSGMCFLVPPQVLVSYRPDHEHPWDYLFVAFNGNKIEEYLDRIGVSKGYPILEPSNTIEVEESFNYILDADLHPKSKDFQAISGFYGLLAALCECNESKMPHSEKINKQSAYVRDAIEFIEQNYSQPITVEDVSKYVGINRKYMTRLFNEIISDSPKSYLMHFRMDKARVLLQDSSFSIKEVSHSVGYADALVFSKVFKKIVGSCPREYRASLTK